MKNLRCLLILAGAAAVNFSVAQTPAAAAAAPTPLVSPWVPDLGNGTFKNPVIYADYSDPDVVRVGDDFYLTASSFTCVPGLPILHSKDLVNWTIIGHALPVQVPADHFSAVRSGQGVWAPCIRFHNGKYYIYYPDPDFGIYVVTATNPAGPWSEPIMVKAGKGLIDPTPLFDDDGKTWLLHALARSRAGRANVLILVPLNAEGTAATGEGKDVIVGENFNITGLEGPKFYKMNGYYWVFAPFGGVSNGSQGVFRAKNIEGPYEMRNVLTQGDTAINGPHQGGLVDTPDGKQWWFVHFQQKGAWGRITHLQPVVWREDGWPIMGNFGEGAAPGTPVLTHALPNVGKTYPPAEPQTSDEFGSKTLGLQWQWLANPPRASSQWYSLELTNYPGCLELSGQPPQNSLVIQPNLLLQKLPAPAFTVTTKLQASAQFEGERAGLIIYGAPCAWIGLVKTATGWRLSQAVSRAVANAPDTVTETAGPDVPSGTVYLAFTMTDNSRAQFSYSLDGQSYTALGPPVTVAAISGSWIGAKFGLFAITLPRPVVATATPMPIKADFDWVHVTPIQK